MSAPGVNQSRRRVLVAATTAVGAIGAGFVAVPFIASMNPSAKARAAGAPVEADISKLEAGALLRVKWRGKPVWIVKRTPEMLAALPTLDSQLTDPESLVPQQPDYCKNPTRSIKPEIWIAIGICTHLGCSPTYRPEVAPDDLGKDWKGGFFCPCHGSRYDLAGRVYKGVPAPINLLIPNHQYLNDTTILVGQDQGAA
ncbi:ubiquinol-cytochrome c reductase iron-sulfur subunit [uncultured Thiodictyon sp.]|uniref:ubiquinol-cytochrome c reductase iron-sulfur subunit n=1 Tax=uncultured Thiodictyon sp. TaxID=1846217 RepID=UPI0025ED3BB2|nr:ubiquinol-cytochrome c reductase iron-sulfur subunit [uncultured Thiodictyon sp.]